MVTTETSLSRHFETASLGGGVAPEDPITPGWLLDQIRDAHGVTAIEDLRGKTANSVRTLQRWKKEGYPANVAAFLDILRQLDLIREPEEVPASEEAHSRHLLQAVSASVGEMVDRQAETLEILTEVQDRLTRAEASLETPRAERANGGQKRPRASRKR